MRPSAWKRENEGKKQNPDTSYNICLLSPTTKGRVANFSFPLKEAAAHSCCLRFFFFLFFLFTFRDEEHVSKERNESRRRAQVHSQHPDVSASGSASTDDGLHACVRVCLPGACVCVRTHALIWNAETQGWGPSCRGGLCDRLSGRDAMLQTARAAGPGNSRRLVTGCCRLWENENTASPHLCT